MSWRDQPRWPRHAPPDPEGHGQGGRWTDDPALDLAAGATGWAVRAEQQMRGLRELHHPGDADADAPGLDAGATMDEDQWSPTKTRTIQQIRNLIGGGHTVQMRDLAGGWYNIKSATAPQGHHYGYVVLADGQQTWQRIIRVTREANAFITRTLQGDQGDRGEDWQPFGSWNGSEIAYLLDQGDRVQIRGVNGGWHEVTHVEPADMQRFSQIITDVGAFDGGVPWQTRVIRDANPAMPVPGAADREARRQQVYEFGHPPDGQLPGNAATLTEMLQMAQRVPGGHDRIPVTPEMMRRVEAIWNYQDNKSGLHSEVTQVRAYHTGELHIAGKILDENDVEVGEFTRTWETNHGPAEIHHSFFRIQRDLQGGGFTTRWFEQALAKYEQEGVQQVTVGADLDVGGYTWTHWFDFQNPRYAQDFLRSMRNSLQRVFTTQATFDEIDRLLERIDRGEHVTAFEVGQVGRAQSQLVDRPIDVAELDPTRDYVRGTLARRGDGSLMETWVGKQFMLGKSWAGILRFGQQPGAAVAQAEYGN